MQESQWRCERGDESHVSVKSVELKGVCARVKPLLHPLCKNMKTFLILKVYSFRTSDWSGFGARGSKELPETFDHLQ